MFKRILTGAPVTYLLLGVLAFAVLYSSMPAELTVHPDTVRDLILARDCHATQGCVLAGAPSSIPGVQHGGLWVVHLAVIDQLGGSIPAVRLVSLLCLVAALLIIAAISEFLAGRTAAIIAAAAGTAGCLAVPTLWVFQWNPTLIPLPATALFACALLAMQTRRPVYYVMTSFCLAMAVQLHPSALVWLGPLSVLYLAYGPSRPVVTAAGVLAALVIPVALLSKDALRQTVGALSQAVPPPPVSLDVTSGTQSMLLGALIVLHALSGIAYFIWRRRFRRDGPPVAGILFLSIAPIVTVKALSLSTGIVGLGHYYLPTLPAALVLPSCVLALLSQRVGQATGIERLVRRCPDLARWVAAVAIVLAGYVVAPQQKDDDIVTFEDVELVAPVLADSGIDSWREAARHLRGPQVVELLNGLPLHLPMRGSPPEAWGPRAVRTILFVKSRTPPPSPLPVGWTVIPKANERWLYLVPQRSAINWSEFEFWFAHSPDDRALSDRRATMVQFAKHGFEASYHPLTEALSPDDQWHWLHLNLDVRPSSQSPLTLVPLARGSTGWIRGGVVKVAGLAAEPGFESEVVLAAGQAGRIGQIEFRWPVSPQQRTAALSSPPLVLEMREGEEQLVEIMEGAR